MMVRKSGTDNGYAIKSDAAGKHLSRRFNRLQLKQVPL